MEKEAHFWNILNKNVGIILQVFPQFGNINIQASARKIVAGTPDLVQNHLFTIWPAFWIRRYSTAFSLAVNLLDSWLILSD